MTRFFILLATLAFALSINLPALAGYGAVAYDQGARKQGFAWDEPTQERANARRDCGSEACKVIGVPPGKCAALATPDSGPAWGGAVRKSVDEAKLRPQKLSEVCQERVHC